MKQLLRIKIISAMILLLTIATAYAQRARRDSIPIFKEFIQIGAWYQHVPLQMELNFRSQTFPSVGGDDTSGTNMTIFYGKSEFYMQAEGLEQIVNDSLVVMINNEAKMIKLYHNQGQWKNHLEKTTKMFVTDSSLNSLVQNYSASRQSEGGDTRRITLQSRDKIFGTVFPREAVSVTYNQSTHEPVTFTQSRFTLIPLDAASYQSLANDKRYEGRLVTVKKKGKEFFFMVKEHRVYLAFISIQRNINTPPVRQQDRLVRLDNGSYQPVKEYQGYFISNEF